MSIFNLKKISTALLLLVGMCASAQSPLHPEYVHSAGAGETFEDRYRLWQPGNTYSASQAEDEEFFISRVKPKARFNNAQTQVNTALNPARKFLFWCPIGQHPWNALPVYFYDSEVFNTWSYVDHFGNWTAGLIRMPGAFADICHKNGVTTSVVAAIPWAADVTGTDNSGGKGLKALIDGGAPKLLKFLRYYGIDGIGLNSEFNFSADMTTGFRTLLKDAAEQKTTYNWPTYSTAWYNLMTTSGSVGGDGGGGYLGQNNSGWFQHDNKEVSNYLFLNYPWTEGSESTALSYLQSSQSRAEQLGRSSFDVYAGINMQGASRVYLPALSNYNISIGVWGAHNSNMLYERRNFRGSSPEVQQNTYMLSSEQFFTGGTQNPVNTPPLSNKFGASPEFHGISKLITARSSLQGDLATDPFVSYFNLGNGKFFNYQGKTTFPKEWYNIGMQDYLPTWRWWITNTFMGRDAANVPSGMKAQFTWEDAWFGGSSMEVTGTNTGETYLHLFKTKYALRAGDKLKIRYKVVEGSAQMRWSCSAEGTETTPVNATIVSKVNSTVNLNTWVEKEILIGSSIGQLNLAGKTLAMMALRFTGAENLKMRIGEISLTRTPAATPAAPVITLSKALGYSFKGVDFKVVYKMNGGSAVAGEPVYNSDVNTWYYKIYSQQEGETQQTLCTTTTSWAAYVVGAPVNNTGANRVRFGVSAVSLDGNTESPIAWSDYATFPTPVIHEDIGIDKPVIKAGEDFTVKYLDPFHPEATKWEIISQADNAVKATKNGGTFMTAQLAQTGIYDARITYRDTTIMKRGLVQISGPEVGALPKINTLKANDSEATVKVNTSENVNFSYIGREADGYVSRGLRLQEEPFQIPIRSLNLVDKVTSFSIAFWYRAEKATTSFQMLNIRDVNSGWPQNNWGFVWNQIYPNGTFDFSVKSGSGGGNEGLKFADPNYRFEPNTWTHLAYTFGWNAGNLTVKIYANGKLLASISNIPSNNVWSLTQTNDLLIGGTAAFRGGLNGVLDEFQVYNKALTESEVIRSMSHFEQADLPTELIAYFDFESTPEASGHLRSTGTNTNILAGTAESRPKIGGREGEVEFFPKKSTFFSGAPFIAGKVYKIETLPTWKLDGATISSKEGNSSVGKATVTYPATGNYTATLTLSNAWGSDTKTFQYVEVTPLVGIDQTTADATYSVYPNPFVDEVNVKFTNRGTYTVQVLNISGQTIFSQTVDANDNGFANIKVNAPKGNYLVRILQNAKTVKAVKVIKN